MSFSTLHISSVYSLNSFNLKSFKPYPVAVYGGKVKEPDGDGHVHGQGVDPRAEGDGRAAGEDGRAVGGRSAEHLDNRLWPQSHLTFINNNLHHSVNRIAAFRSSILSLTALLLLHFLFTHISQ